ncbi:unnamed protein product [Chironomus riparius]|uniref:C2H2-type domain-containing protein n=1 Tax=Chironomus riparius TaxID=315576 RepID=A0A9N9RR79_9DIPT|nr:unnamed protein product [Chironomus riparius]
MDEKSIDPLELKKKILFPHLEFVKEMLVKVKGNNIEEKWKIMHECITSDKKRPSYEKIKQMEKTLIALKSQSKQKSNLPENNPAPSTSKGTTENIIPKDLKTIENIMERDPRKRNSMDPSSTTIYNVKPRTENERVSRPQIRNDKQPIKFQPKDESERSPGRWDERSGRFPNYNEKLNRNFKESFRGRGGFQRGRPFSRHSFDNNQRRLNQRHSPMTFNDRPQFLNERNQSLGKDDSNFKRKRSQSPVIHTSRQLPKRRSSCYQPNEKQTNNETLKGQSSTDNKPSTDNEASNSKNVEIAKANASNTATKVVQKNDDKTPSNSEIDDSQSMPVKNKADKNEGESLPVNLAEAIKKIQSIKIPKLGMNKNTNKTEPKTSKGVNNDKDSKKTNTSILSKEQEKRSKDEENKQKIGDNSAESIEKEIDNDKLQKIASQNIAEASKIPEINKSETTKCDLKVKDQEGNQSDTVDKIESTNSGNIEIEAEIKTKETIQEVEETKPMDTTVDDIEVEKNNSELCKLTSLNLEPTETMKHTEELQSQLIDTFNEEEQDNNKCDQIVGSSSKFDSTLTNDKEKETNEIAEQNIKHDQNEATSSTAFEMVPKASALTNLLENEEDDPEKVLEGLISVLGAEKVKKMQELLLKNTIKSEKITEPKCEDETRQNEHQSNIFKGNKSDIKHDTPLIKAEIEHNSETNEKVAETIITEPLSSIPLKPEITPTTSPVKSKATSSSSSEKKRKKPRKKKLTELDKLHENILSSIDCEGIMRACGQPRVSVKPKTYEGSTIALTNKYPETKPFIIKLIKLNLTTDDMPVTLNDEFYQKYLTIQDTKSRTKPKPLKRRTISQEKPTVKVPKIEFPEFKAEPTASLIINELPVAEIQKPINEIQIESNINTEPENPTNVISKKKKRRLLPWSKGILKKKPKRFKFSSVYDWEDVDSSDDNNNYDKTMKLKTFSNLLNRFARKCGYKKISIRSRVHPKTDNSISNNCIAAVPDKSENDSKFVIPKRINLPLEKNLLTMISKNTGSEIKSPTYIPESPKSPKITIKLPTVEKSVQSFSTSIQQTQQSDALNAGPSNEMNTKIYSSQNNTQKVVIVKPLAKETHNEIVKVRSLSAKEQQELKEALSGTKNQQSAPSIAEQNNEIIKNMMSNLNTSLNITKISAQKTANVSTPKDETTRKSLPMISNVESISPNVSSIQNNSRIEQNKMPRIVSITSTASLSVEESTSANEKAPKINDISSKNVLNTLKPLPTVKNQPPPDLPEPVEGSNAKNESVEVVDLIDDDDDDDVVDIMRPWIENSDYKSRKDQLEAMKMINSSHCLASLYKCMGSTCSYFSNDKSLFEKHLELHHVHQKTDSQNYLLCCYCSFRPKSINVLLVHIENAHSYGKFGCKYCFYRSINEYQVTANHHSNFHRLKEKCVVVFEPRKIKNENIEKSMISESIPKVCHPLPCPYCRIGIYTIAEFESHVSSHKESFTTVCIKCNQATNKLSISQHLLKCFNKFGNFQCVFCVFGSNIFSAIDNHLSTEHPDKLSYFAERSLNAGKDPTTFESLTTKELGKRITGNIKKLHLRYSFNDEVYKNSGNVGRLADNLIIDQTARPRPSSSDSSCFIQIGEVVSLHD